MMTRLNQAAAREGKEHLATLLQTRGLCRNYALPDPRSALAHLAYNALCVDSITREDRRLQDHVFPSKIGDGIQADVIDRHAQHDRETQPAIDQTPAEFGTSGY